MLVALLDLFLDLGEGGSFVYLATLAFNINIVL